MAIYLSHLILLFSKARKTFKVGVKVNLSEILRGFKKG